jgi:hypothetical protein
VEFEAENKSKKKKIRYFGCLKIFLVKSKTEHGSVIQIQIMIGFQILLHHQCTHIESQKIKSFQLMLCIINQAKKKNYHPSIF